MAITLSDIRKYFGYDSLATFRADWQTLTEDDKAQVKSGIEDGSYTY